MLGEDLMNDVYRERNELAVALACVFPCAVGFDADEPDWPVLYINLPTGQVSYHFAPADADLLEAVPRASVTWDGHTNEEKSRRLAALNIWRWKSVQQEEESHS